MSSEEEKAADEAFNLDELSERMAKLSSKRRRETLYQLSGQFKDDLGENPINVHSESETKDIPANVTANVQNKVYIDNFERRLPRFSSKIPVPNGEVTFKKWKVAADRLMQSKEITEEKIKDYIFRSLLGTPDDIIDQYRSCSAAEIIDVLEKNYGSVVDGEELLLQFYDMVQSPSQSASDYLQELFVALSQVVQNDGLHEGLLNKTLLKQFLRGSIDEELNLKLRLQEKSYNIPPPYTDLIVSIRREEQLRKGKKLLRSRQAKSQGIAVAEKPTTSTELEDCRKKIADLESKLQQQVLLVQQTVTQQENKVRKSFFCYRCGKDFHKATTCVNSPNEELVKSKMAERYNGSKN